MGIAETEISVMERRVVMCIREHVQLYRYLMGRRVMEDLVLGQANVSKAVVRRIVME